MLRRNAGFSGLEIVVVLVIAGIIMAMAFPALSRTLSRRGALNARDALVLLGARARSIAIENGARVELRVDPAADRAWIVDAAGTTFDDLDYSGEFEADVTVPGGAVICVSYNPRGLGDNCGAGTLPDTVTFSRGAYTARAEIRALGQVQKL